MTSIGVRAGLALVTAMASLDCASNLRGTVGARFGRDADGHVYVREVPPDLGAARAGIREGDELILIEGRDVRPMSDATLHNVLSGEVGTRVRFTLLRGDEVLRTTVRRTAPPAVPAPR